MRGTGGTSATDGFDAEVVIIGAGPAGLHAARLVVASGGSVVVLEARDRVGGRLLSVGPGLDLGPTWYWENEARMVRVVAELGIDTFDQHTAGDMLFQSDGQVRQVANQLNQPAKRFAGGAQALATAMAATLPVGVLQPGVTVETIRQVDRGVEVVASDGTRRAAQVIVAVPPATAVGRMKIEGLSDRVRSLAAATPVWMGAMTKVVAEYPTAFWRERGLAGAAFSHDGPMREVHDMSGPAGTPGALFGFAQQAPDEAAAIDQLVALFGPDAAEPTALHVMDWRTEPHTSPDNAADLHEYRTYGHNFYQEPSLDGRLHWASTETSVVAPGHIEGALAAAERAVARM